MISKKLIIGSILVILSLGALIAFDINPWSEEDQDKYQIPIMIVIAAFSIGGVLFIFGVGDMLILKDPLEGLYIK